MTTQLLFCRAMFFTKPVIGFTFEAEQNIFHHNLVNLELNTTCLPKYLHSQFVYIICY